MKKIFCFVTVLVICLACVMPAAAEFANPAVTDKAGYLTDEQFSDITKKLDEIRGKYNFDVSVYIEENMSGDSAMETADDIFDYDGYGAGAAKDGIMLYLSASPRKYWFTTHAYGEHVFNSNGLNYLENNVLPYLKDDDYYNAFVVYADKTEELLAMAVSGTPYNESEDGWMFTLCVIVGALGIPLIVAFAAMKSKLRKMNTAVGQNYASNYVKNGSFNLVNSRDIFLYSSVTKSERVESSSDSHTSSSGERHGGTGGSY